jgi:phosphate transport system substrate-binding protein
MIRLLLLATLLLTAACGRSGCNLTGAIKTDGSSTVAPLTSAVVGAFVQKNPDVQISVSATGTTAGFQSFCQGTTEIANASRPINAAEESACVQSGVQFIELPVAQDAITVIVHPSNDWAQNMSIAELKKLWEPAAEGRVMRWADVRADWPAEPIKLVGPGPLSGTFDFFTETIVGVVDSSRRDYSGSEDDDAIVKAVANDRLALGFLGYGNYERHKDALRAVAIAGPHAARLGAVLPSSENVRRGVYAPLALTLFIYVNSKTLDRPEVSAFVRFYLTQDEALVSSVGGIPLSSRAYELVRDRVQQRTAGTMFAEGRPVENLERMLSGPLPAANR